MYVDNEENFVSESPNFHRTDSVELADDILAGIAFFDLEQVEDVLRRLLGNVKVANWSLVPDRVPFGRADYEASVHARNQARIAAGERSEAVLRDLAFVLTDRCYERYVMQAESSNVYKAVRVENARRELETRTEMFRILTGHCLEFSTGAKGELRLAPFRLDYSDGVTLLDYAEDGSLTIFDLEGKIYCSHNRQTAPLVELLAKRGIPLAS